MSLKIIGAGIGRTGTTSLKLASEMLLDGKSYHMSELTRYRPDHVPLWHGAILGYPPNWEEMLAGYVATFDWPSAAVWDHLHAAFPEAFVLLSSRPSDEWWDSFSTTILPATKERSDSTQWGSWYDMSIDMFKKLTPDYEDRESCIAAYEAHNEHVRLTVPPNRLIDWTPSDGWGPICSALALPEPNAPFPETNQRDDFQVQNGLKPLQFFEIFRGLGIASVPSS